MEKEAEGDERVAVQQLSSRKVETKFCCHFQFCFCVLVSLIQLIAGNASLILTSHSV